MIDYKKELNSEQYEVVTKGNGHCLVLAGAGSGKTRAITYRVAYLLENGVSPENILLVTFTNKAAREMVFRVQQLTQGNIRLPWSGTFHHICYRMLRKYAPILEYKNNFTILDSTDSRDLIKICLKIEGVDRTARRFPSAAVLQSIISFSSNAMLSIEDVIEKKYPQWIEIAPTITRIAIEYFRRKKESNAMDFDDLLVNTCLLLSKSTEIRKKFSEQFKYVLVDEYQDTNKIQATIIRLFAGYHKNLLVVGDDAQSIYSFRAAEIKNILDFENDFSNAQIFKIEINYRSTPDILEMANNVISNNIHQFEKKLRAKREESIKPELHAFAGKEGEAEFIASRILELRDEGIELENIAVLFRASHHSQVLEMELTKRNIPYDYRGGVRFFERSHIKDVLAYIRVYANNSDSIAWSRILNMQVGIGPATVQKIINLVQCGKKFEEITGSLPARARIGWNDFLSIYACLESEIIKEPSSLVLAVAHSKYKEYLQSEYPDYRERMQDIRQLSAFAENQKDLNRFLAEASLQESYTRPASKSSDEENGVVLSTIHQAKGLEWDVVFIINVTNGQFPNDRALKEKNGLEEERRLFYVALTRAKTFLYMSYSLTGGFDVLSGGPSMFLEEVGTDLIDNYSLSGNSIWSDQSEESDDVVYVREGDDWENNKSSFLRDISDL